ADGAIPLAPAHRSARSEGAADPQLEHAQVPRTRRISGVRVPERPAPVRQRAPHAGDGHRRRPQVPVGRRVKLLPVALAVALAVPAFARTGDEEAPLWARPESAAEIVRVGEV